VRRAVWASSERPDVFPPGGAAYDGLVSRVNARGQSVASVAELRGLAVADLADVSALRREQPAAAAQAGAGLDEYEAALLRLLETLELDCRTPPWEVWQRLFERPRRGGAAEGSGQAASRAGAGPVERDAPCVAVRPAARRDAASRRAGRPLGRCAAGRDVP